MNTRTYPSFSSSSSLVRIALSCIALLSFGAAAANAQSLGYEGPTGVFVTPLAYTSASPTHGLGKPSVAYHFLDTGSVVGTYSTVSITEGVAGRFEFGYTGVTHSAGEDKSNAVNLSPLWNSGYSIVHGKATIVSENAFQQKWLPAIAVGGIVRMNDSNVGNGVNSDSLHTALSITSGVQGTTNGDIYLVATKVIPQFTKITKKVPLLLSGGVRGTNAQLWGIAGNAPEWSANAFGTVGFVFTAPKKTTIILAAEAVQQPRHLAVTLPSGHETGILDFPTSEVYAVRVTPGFAHKFNADLGVLQAAGNVGSSPTLPSVLVNLNARARVAFGLSYGF
ncbi:hypothetical protein [Silvibacterium sp.]|uniref:hypothetical protein n=1 Tax=Silvibacterium sp. TaxID=1964179 RepID=UPI0039E3D9D5